MGNWEFAVDQEGVRKTLSALKPNNELFECRILGTAKKDVLSGYFKDADTLIRAFEKVDLRKKNIYITVNKVNEALYSRDQKDHFVAGTTTTSDHEIDSYEWLFIDFDPVRPTGVSSTEDELNKAGLLKNTVSDYLNGKGFPTPLEAMSGNGYHLLYRMEIPNTDENIQMVNDFLHTLSEQFGTAAVDIDTTNSNPSRICKLHGTLAQKGADTADRPHRMSFEYPAPEEFVSLTTEHLQRVLDDFPRYEPAKPQKQTDGKFDLMEFMGRHGMTYREDIGRNCRIFQLDQCPFNSSHTDGDSKIFLYDDGAISFKCHHNSCAGKKWQDVRLLFEPNAYEYKNTEEQIESGYQQHKKAKQEAPELIPFETDEAKKQSKEKPKKSTRKLKTAEALMEKEIPEPVVYVGVGEEIPILVEGTCILSAKPKLGKSWLVLAMCLAICRGQDFLGYKTRQCSCLYLDLETSESLQQKRIKKALAGDPVPKNFYLDTETDTLDNGFVEQINSYLEQDPNIGVVVIDVFQVIRSKAQSVKESEYEHAYRDLTPLNELAQQKHISIILVCHDRKMVDEDDPFSNILGSTGLQGAATEMIVMFRKRDNPIHISVKGKTIDGLPELNVVLKNGQWSMAEAINNKEQERLELENEYLSSDIREAVCAIANTGKEWKGRCSVLVNDATQMDKPIQESTRDIGGFLHRHQGRFLAMDRVKIEIIDNGTGPKIYTISKSTIDTIDEIPFDY